MKRSAKSPISRRKAGLPPRSADRLLEWFAAPYLLESLQGDLHEEFAYQVERVGERRARWRYWRDVLGFIRLWVIKRKPNEYPNPVITDMLRNYWTVAWRSLAKNKLFSAINITGLALGLSCCLLTYLWIQDERSYDAFHKNGDRLYRVMVNSVEKNGEITNSFENSPGILSSTLKQEVPEITHATTVTWEWNDRLRVGGKASKQKGRVISNDFFKMFSFPILKGNPEIPFPTPNSIVISQRVASFYYGSANPIGRTIQLNEKDDYVVSGVFATIPANSSLRFDYARSFETFAKNNPWITSGWGDFGPSTYVMVRADVSVKKVDDKIRNFLTQHDKVVDNKTLSLQSYQQQYLYSRFENGLPVGGRIDYVHLFTLVALFILLIACINFVNLATAQSLKRAKEVGIRKVAGAAKAYLVGQFIGEAFFLTIVAFFVALILTSSVLPLLNSITGKQLVLPLNNVAFISAVVGLVLTTTLTAGSYPAWVLSSFKPVNVLKGAFVAKPRIATLRKGLVVFQFSLSVALISSTLLVYQQMRFIQTQNLGLDRENVVYVEFDGDLSKNYQTFKQLLLQSNAIQTVTTINTVPTNVGNATGDVEWPNKNPADKASFWLMGATHDFAQTLKIKVKEGREFSTAFSTDSTGFMLNESAVKRMKLVAPVGQTISLWGKRGVILGVMNDFHLQSLHRSIEPMIAYFDQRPQGYAVIRINAGATQQAISTIEQAYKTVNPQYPFSYQFADEAYRQQYKSEMLVGTLAVYFACLAILIACLGLFGFATFTAEQRTKEIGVRKVLGASVTSIVALLSKDFLKLVLIAIVIASPIVLYAMDKWLEGFAYRIDIKWWTIALAGLLAVAIALLTVSYQSIKAALTNPVKSLRSE